jgi:hypothetical protein
VEPDTTPIVACKTNLHLVPDEIIMIIVEFLPRSPKLMLKYSLISVPFYLACHPFVNLHDFIKLSYDGLECKYEERSMRIWKYMVLERWDKFGILQIHFTHNYRSKFKCQKLVQSLSKKTRPCQRFLH